MQHAVITATCVYNRVWPDWNAVISLNDDTYISQFIESVIDVLHPPPLPLIGLVSFAILLWALSALRLHCISEEEDLEEGRLECTKKSIQIRFLKEKNY